jgi:hypothetical protein
VIRGVTDPVHPTVRELRRDHAQQLPGQLNRAGGALARPQPEQDRQPHRGCAKRQPHHDPGYRTTIPATAHRLPRAIFLPPCADPSLGPERVVDLTPPPFEQRLIDHHDDRLVRIQQPIGDQPSGEEPQPVDLPHRMGEEPARRVEGDRPAIRAPASIPTTLRRDVYATIPVTSTVNKTNMPRRRNAGRNVSNTAAHDSGKITAGPYRTRRSARHGHQPPHPSPCTPGQVIMDRMRVRVAAVVSGADAGSGGGWPGPAVVVDVASAVSGVDL